MLFSTKIPEETRFDQKLKCQLETIQESGCLGKAKNSDTMSAKRKQNFMVTFIKWAHIMRIQRLKKFFIRLLQKKYTRMLPDNLNVLVVNG